MPFTHIAHNLLIIPPNAGLDHGFARNDGQGDHFRLILGKPGLSVFIAPRGCGCTKYDLEGSLTAREARLRVNDCANAAKHLREITINIMFKGCGFGDDPIQDLRSLRFRCVTMLKALEIYSSSEDETIRIGATVGRILMPGDAILLTGELGSGKTRLAKGIVSAATGVAADEVVSPTFTLINRFGDDFPINHADLYRIDPNRLEDIDLEDALEEGGALVVEWAENIRDLFENPLEICIMYTERENERRIIVRWKDDGTWDRRIRILCEQFRISGACGSPDLEEKTA